MQVSWIDPEEIRGLLAQIEGPRKVAAASNVAWEVHTLPILPVQTAPADNLIDPPAPKKEKETLPPDLPLSDGGSGPRGGELWRIRENLRSLREQAQVSGILPRGEAPETANNSTVEQASLSSIKDALTVQLADALSQASTQAPTSPFSFAAPTVPVQPTAVEPTIEPVTSAPVTMAEELPPARPATTPMAPVNIEYAGPASSGHDYEPLFGTGIAAPALPVEAKPVETPAPTTPAEALESILDQTPVVESQPENAAPPFVPPALGLSDRLGALARWTCERLGTKELLLVDDYGDVLWGGHAQTPLVLSAMMAWHASQRGNAESAVSEPQRIDKQLTNGRALTVLPARTRYGIVSLAAIQEHPMTAADEKTIREALILAVEGPVD